MTCLDISRFSPPRFPFTIEVVVNKAHLGLGDLFFGIKLTQILKKRFPTGNITLSPDNITVTSADLEILLKNHKFEDIEQMEGLPKVIIEGPCFAKGELEDEMIDDIESTGVTDRRVVTDLAGEALFKISEYGWVQRSRHAHYEKLVKKKQLDIIPSCIFTGLGRYEQGIYFDEELYQRTQSSLQSEVSTVLKEIKDPNLKLFLSKSLVKPYFGYSNKRTIPFCHAIYQNQKHNQEDIDICLIYASRTPSYHHAIDEINYEAYLPDKSCLANIKTFELWDEDKLLLCHNTGNPGKKIRVFVKRNFLPHEDFLSLLSISQAYVLMTGDESFSEAISSEKIIFYELLEHKKQLNEDFIDLAKSLNLTLTENFLIAQRDVSISFISEIDLEILEKIKTVSVLLNNSKLAEEFKILSKHIYEHKNLETNLSIFFRNVVEDMHKSALLDDIHCTIRKRRKIAKMKKTSV